MEIQVKICGIRTEEGALIAVESGADYLGFNFVQSSKRFISVPKAKKIIKKVKGKVKTVGIFKDADAALVEKIAKELQLDFVQLHGSESAAYINKLHVAVIKAVPLQAESTVSNVLVDMGSAHAQAYLLDRPKQGKGTLINTEKAGIVARYFSVFLAGGLTPENVQERVRKVQPFGVDVAGGIETDGREDPEKIKRFIQNAKGVKRG